MSQLVTGDAVVLGLQPARLPSRMMAIALDLVVLIGSFLLVSVLLLGLVLSLGTAAAAAVQVALLVLMLVGIPVAVETLSRGRSLGKLAFGLRVVRNDGGPVRFRHALVRGAVGFVEIFLTAGSAPVIASLVSADGRRLGDVFAGTLVVRERVPGRRPGPAAAMVHPALAAQFAGLDLSRVPDPLWLAIRQYLTRAGQLDQQVAWSMAVRLAGDVVARVGTPAPPGIHPAEYLRGVAGERQRREAERAFGTGPAAGPSPARPRPVPPPGAPQPFAAPPQEPAPQAPPAPYAPPSEVPGPPAAQPPRPAEPAPAPGAREQPPRGTGFTPPA